MAHPHSVTGGNPSVTTPASNDDEEFYTPTSTARPASSRDGPAMTSPMALNFSRALPPVWEEEADDARRVRMHAAKNARAVGSGRGREPYYRIGEAGAGEEDSSADSSMDMSDFRTPKQHGRDWKMDNINDDKDDDDDEFFSPLVHHAVHTPSSNYNPAGSPNPHVVALEFDQAHSFDNEQLSLELSVSPSAIPSDDIPVAAVAPAKTPTSHNDPPTKDDAPLSISPKYSDVKQELQSLLLQAKSLTPPEKARPVQPPPAQPPGDAMMHPPTTTIRTPPPSTSLGHSSSARSTHQPTAGSATLPPQSPSLLHNTSLQSTSLSFHLHSPCVSSLPPKALTVDFVRQCEDAETLKAILSLLSTDGGNVRGSAKKQPQCRYPSLVRLVEKRLQKMERDGIMMPPREEEQHLHLQQPEVLDEGRPCVQQHGGLDGADKENVKPQGHPKEWPFENEECMAAPDGGTHSRPMECITVLHDASENSADGNGNHNNGASGSPSLTLKSSMISSAQSSLDMNLSVSLFAMDDESYFWKHGMGDEKKEKEEDQQSSPMAKGKEKEERQHKASQTEEGAVDDGDMNRRYAELKEKLASTLTSNARLTGEVDSLVNKHNNETNDLSSRLQKVTNQLSQLKVDTATEKTAGDKRIAELEKINHNLHDEVDRLHEQITRITQQAQSTTHQLQSELETAREQNSTLSQENDNLKQELNELRSGYNIAQREVAKLKLLLDKKNSTTENESAVKMHRVVESAKLANQALANALAVSENDLADAMEARDKSEREQKSLRNHTKKLEDKTAFLSSKVKEMSRELESSRVYIDQLYADLASKSSRSPSKELKANFERKEMEWMELERGYSRRIQELEGQLLADTGSDDPVKHGVSLNVYRNAVKQTRHYKLESMKNEQTIGQLKATVGDLREQLDGLQQRSPANNTEGNQLHGLEQRSMVNHVGGKSFKVLQQFAISSNAELQKNDENAAPPTNAREHQDLGALKQLSGKQLSRVTAVKAAGGRKGLSEQLKRARRFGEKA